MRRRRPLWSPLGGCGLLSLGLLLALDGSVLFQTSAIEVELQADDTKSTCLYINMNVNFSVTYETRRNKYKNASFALPEDVTYGDRTCKDDHSNSLLVVLFGNGNSWMVSFSKTQDTYQGNITFTYNTNDTKLFPDAKRIGPVTIRTAYPEVEVPINTVYICKNLSSIETDAVSQSIWNVTLQAFIEDSFLSSERTYCGQDVSPSYVTETTTLPSATAHDNETTRTHTTPDSVATTEPPTFIQPWARPTTGTYSVSRNGTVCLMANMALQLNVSGKFDVLLNINPDTTVVSGSCENRTSVLNLKDGNKEVKFVFSVRNVSYEIFYLSEVKVTVTGPGNETHKGINSELSYWEASVGRSYMCRKETVVEVNSYFQLNVFDLQVQPFDVKEEQFSAAEECYNSDLLLLIPIVLSVLFGLSLVICFATVMVRRLAKSGKYHAV